jgi:hypothetical protein
MCWHSKLFPHRLYECPGFQQQRPQQEELCKKKFNSIFYPFQTKNQTFKVPELTLEATQRYANVEKKRSLVNIIGYLKIGQQNYLFEQKFIQSLEPRTVAAQNSEFSCTNFLVSLGG